MVRRHKLNQYMLSSFKPINRRFKDTCLYYKSSSQWLGTFAKRTSKFQLHKSSSKWMSISYFHLRW